MRHKNENRTKNAKKIESNKSRIQYDDLRFMEYEMIIKTKIRKNGIS